MRELKKEYQTMMSKHQNTLHSHRSNGATTARRKNRGESSDGMATGRRNASKPLAPATSTQEKKETGYHQRFASMQ